MNTNKDKHSKKSILIDDQIKKQMIKNYKKLKIKGVNVDILSPTEWIKKVKGVDRLNYYKDCGLKIDSAIYLMELYGEYVSKKVK